jgi:hypothetical protein
VTGVLAKSRFRLTTARLRFLRILRHPGRVWVREVVAEPQVVHVLGGGGRALKRRGGRNWWQGRDERASSAGRLTLGTLWWGWKSWA